MHSTMRKILLLASVLAVGWPLMLWGDPPSQGPTTAPAAAAGAAAPPAPAGTGPKVTVTGVTGSAQKAIAGEGEPQWQPIKVGDVLDEHTIIRTGLNAAVMLQMDDRGEIKINSATKIGINEFQKDGSKLKTNLGMKYGTVRAHVDSSRGPNDFRVATPTATLSVRGSRPEVGYSIEAGSQGHSYEGHLTLQTGGQGGGHGGQGGHGGGGGFSQTVNPGEGLSDSHTLPSDTLLFQFHSALGDVHGGTTANEQFSELQFGGNGRNAGSGYTPSSGGSNSQGGGSAPPPIPPPPPATPPPAPVPTPAPRAAHGPGYP